MRALQPSRFQSGGVVPSVRPWTGIASLGLALWALLPCWQVMAAPAGTAQQDDQAEAGPRTKPLTTPSAANRAKVGTAARPSRQIERRETGRPSPRRLSRDLSKEDPEQAAKARTSGRKPAPDSTLESDIDAILEQMLKPAEERRYSISVDGTYQDLLKGFELQSGLAILGDVPNGTVTYTSPTDMDYEAALSTLREILFSHPENFYIWRSGNSLQVFRITEAPRLMDLNRIYTNVEDFKEADLDQMEVVLVLYAPENIRVADLERIRDFMPDYVRIAPYKDTNALTIMALARDVTKYLQLVDIFTPGASDPREFTEIPIRFVLPSEAVVRLVEFMPDLRRSGSAGTAAPVRAQRGKARAAQEIPLPTEAQGIELIPFDELETLFVRAMPNQIAEIKKYLEIIDREYGLGSGRPLTILLEHIRVERLMDQLRPFYSDAGGAAAAPAKPAARRAARAARAPAGGSGAIVTDSIEIYANPANNTLLVRAEEEELDTLRMYISLFDVPIEQKPERVVLEHADAETVKVMLEQIIARIDSTLAELLLVAVDGGDLLLVGPAKAVELAREIVADLDLPTEEVTAHFYQCRNATPSALVTLLTSLDKESAGAPAVPQPRKGPAARRARRASRTDGGTKYHADDQTRTLYVICNDLEWEAHYQPLLASLDRAVLPDMTVIPIDHGEPDEVLDKVNDALGPGKGGVKPTLLLHADGVLVLGANESEFEQVRALVAAFDIDPQIQRRTFTLKFADPAEVKQVLESLVVKNPTGRAALRGEAKGRLPAPVAGSERVKIVETGRRELIVQAPPREMAEIADLVAELDVDPLNMTVKVYNFPPGTDVREIGQTLASFYPSSASVPIGDEKGGKRGQQKTEQGDIRFIPYEAARRILVSAPADLIPDIDVKVALLRLDDLPVEHVVDFYLVRDLDPETMVEILEPILKLRYAELIEAGVLPEPPAPKDKGGGPEPFSVRADPRGDRVIFVGPRKLYEKGLQLVAELDRPDRERVVKTVTLEKADPAEMVTAIRAMLTSRPDASSPSASPPEAKGRKGRAASRRPMRSASTEQVTIVEAPGGSVVILEGYAEDVALVEQWVRDFDAVAASGREIKIYAPKNIEVEQFADTIMALLDAGGLKQPPKPKGEDVAFPTDLGGGARVGKDISLMTDVWSGTVLVSATPAKIREIDRIFEMYEGKPGEEPAITRVEPQPFDTYQLEHKEAWDAVYDLEMVLDALWPDPENKPKIDYLFGTNILTIRGRPEDFEKVKKLIVDYVDKPGEEDSSEGFEVVPVKGGMTADDLARWIQYKLGADKVQIQGLLPENEDYMKKVKQIEPCVLPLCAARWMTVLSTAVTEEAEDEEDEPAPTKEVSSNGLSSPQFDEQAAIKADMLRRFTERVEPLPGTEVQEGPTPPVGTPAGPPIAETPPSEPDAAEPEPVPGITISPDNEKGVLVIEGFKRTIADVRTLIDKYNEEIEKMPQPPDIRVFQVNHVDVNTAAEILQAMFNAPRQRLTAQQIRQLQQQQRRGQQQPQQGAEEEEKGRRPKEEQETPEPQPAESATGDIRVVPDPRTRTIIVRAAAEQFPSIIKLLATIDKKGTAADFRIYPLTRLNAAEVEEMLRKMLGLDELARAAQRRPSPVGRQGRGQQGAAAQQQLELALAGLEGESLSLTSADRITLSSSPATNTIMAMAPEKILDQIGELIEQLEQQEAPGWVTRTYKLEHADAEEVAAQLEKLYGKGGKGLSEADGFDPMDVNRPNFIPDPRTNSITVRALEIDLPKLEPLIRQLDVEGGDLFKPKYIQLQFAKPTEIARKLQEAFTGAQVGRKGRKGQVSITGDDGSMQLIVVAPPDVFAAIGEMVAKIDVERTNLEFKIYPLTHARAPDVHQKMGELVRTLIQVGGKEGVDLGVFSAVADEHTNSLVVAGEPSIFPIVELMLGKIDVPPPEPVTIETRVYRLVSASAQEVASTINRMFAKSTTAGAERPQAEANPNSNTLVVRATKKDQDEIWNQVIKPLEEFAEEPTLKLKKEVFDLRYVKADDAAEMLKQWFQDQQDALQRSGVKGLNPADTTVSVTPEVPSNKLLVMASEANLALIKERIASIDREDIGDLSARVTETYPMKYADPPTLANIINQQFRMSGRVAEKDRVDAGADSYTMNVVVTASRENQERIAELIAKMDVDAGGGKVQKVHQLQFARASEVANTVSQALRGWRGTTRRGELPVTVVANDPLNQLIISGVQEDVDEVLPLIEQLDVKPDDETGRTVRVYDVKYVDPGSLIGTINNSFRTDRHQRPEDEVQASYAAGTSSLVVVASEENHAKIKEMLEQVDKESNVERSTHVIKLQSANAEDLANNLTQVYQRTRRQRRDDPGMSITPDPASNSILVYANESELADVQELVTILDVEPEEQRQIRSFKLNYAEAWELHEAVRNFFSGLSLGRRGSPRDQVDVYPNWASNTLVVAASAENMVRVESFIAEVDQPGASDRPVTVVQVENADAASVARALNDVFVRPLQTRRGQETVSITNPQGSNALMIKANPQELEKILAVIDQIEETGGVAGGDLKIIPLRHTDAEEARTILEEYLRKPGAGRGSRGGADLIGDVRISVSTQNNALVLSGQSAQLEEIASVVAQLDVESAEGGVQVIRLQHAHAVDIQPQLKELFEQRRGGPAGRSGGVQPVIVADHATNSLIVRAGPAELNELKALVEQLDDADLAGEDFRIVQVAPSVNVEDMAATLEETFNAVGRRPGGARGGQEEQLVVTPDKRTNSLLLAGAPDFFDKAEAIVRQYEEMSPKGGQVTRIIRTKNIDVNEAQGVIQDLIEENEGGRRTSPARSGRSSRGSRRGRP